MEVRGERRCRDCGERWSYFETGAIECPACGSVRSVGVTDERALHTATDDTLDLTAARSAAADGPLEDAAREAADAARSFVRTHGFVHAGELRPLDDAFIAAQELRHAAVRIEGDIAAIADGEAYFLALLEGADDGERPASEDVPPSLRGARGLAAVASVEAYDRDVTAWLGRNDAAAESRALRERLVDHRKRVAALDGEVPPADADALVAAARALGEHLREESDGPTPALEASRRSLDTLDAGVGP